MSDNVTGGGSSEGGSTESTESLQNSGLSWGKSYQEPKEDEGWDDDSSDSVAQSGVQSSPEAPKAESEDKKESKPKEEVKPPKKDPEYIEIDGQRIAVKDLKATLGKARELDERFRQVADARKNMDAFVQQLKENPLAILTDERLGVDLNKVTEALLQKRIQAEIEDPKDREIRLRDERIKKYEEQENQTKAQREAAEREAVVNKRRQEIGKMFMDAINSTPFANDPEVAGEVVREMAVYARAAKARGEDFDAQKLAEHVQGKYTKAFASLSAKLEGEQLLALLGDGVLRKIRAADLARIKASQGRHEKPDTVDEDTWEQEPANKKAPERKFVDPRDMMFRR